MQILSPTNSPAKRSHEKITVIHEVSSSDEPQIIEDEFHNRISNEARRTETPAFLVDSSEQKPPSTETISRKLSYESPPATTKPARYENLWKKLQDMQERRKQRKGEVTNSVISESVEQHASTAILSAPTDFSDEIPEKSPLPNTKPSPFRIPPASPSQEGLASPCMERLPTYARIRPGDTRVASKLPTTPVGTSPYTQLPRKEATPFRDLRPLSRNYRAQQSSTSLVHLPRLTWVVAVVLICLILRLFGLVWGLV